MCANTKISPYFYIMPAVHKKIQINKVHKITSYTLPLQLQIQQRIAPKCTKEVEKEL